MKRMLSSAQAACGLSLLCCLGWAVPLVNPYHDWIYHDSGEASSIFVPVLISMALLWAVFAGLLWFAEGRRVAVWSGVLCFLPWLLLKDAALLCGVVLGHRLSMALFVGSGVCWIGLLALWRTSFMPLFVRLQRFSNSMLMFAGVCGVLVAGQLVWYFQDARQLELPGVVHAAGAARSVDEVRSMRRAGGGRIIWIILDELSYRQVYEHRYASLALPAFDRLADQATVFTQVRPTANYTEMAVPALMMGTAVDRTRAGSDGRLRLRNSETGRWQQFDQRDTVFQDALNRGYLTAAAGWYNPYCRILPEVLDRCRWVYREDYAGGMFSDASVGSNLAALWRALAGHFVPRQSADNSRESETSAHVADYVDLVAAGDELLRDPSIGFLLLHMPVPHPGGIYDRRTGSFTSHTASYIDNLALADRYLGHVRQVLEARGEWDSSAVVVMGDHSWRTKLIWRDTPGWTAEDEAASDGGKFDDRPAYIVKLPHQKSGGRVDSPFAATRTRALLQGIMEGSLGSKGELAAFAGQGATVQVGSIRAGGEGLPSRGR
ncbi:MAG: sulfatase-like hydrolase/transferase [Acidobacteriota bacterium]|nr:sulfatase-like hydrolase/transferase [Acidobacteriota bacterium]